MQARAILVCLLLGAVKAGAHYVVLIPAELRTDTLEKVCVLILSGNEPISLRLTIQDEKTNKTLLQEELMGNGRQNCFKFTVEDKIIGPDIESLINVTVIGSVGNVIFNQTKMVLLKRYDTLTFIQTDKAIYKPGQSVKFRVVTLNENFIPVQEKYPLVTMLDPQGNRIGQWRDVEPRQGIADLTFDLMPEPLKGFYTIEVRKTRGKVHHHFSVEEYVLPKYELKVEMPKVITILDRTIHVKVCGRYTYGQPVRGEVNGSLCLMMSRYSPQLSRCEQVSGEMDSDGCLIKDISTAKFRLRSSNYNIGVHGQFVLEEAGTGLRISGLAKSDVITEITQITFHQVEDYFKIGLPYTGKLRIKYSTGGPVANVSITLFNSAKPGSQIVTSDQNGIASFSTDTSSWEADPVTFMAIYQINYDEYSYGNTLPRHSKARHQVKPFYSKSNSYLTIVKHPEEIACDSDLDVQVHYNIKGLRVGEQHDLGMFYLLMSRGLIVSMEMKTISVGGSEGSGDFHIILPVSTDISPIARLLVFAVLPDGETIGDNARYDVSKCFRNKVTLQFSVAEDLPKSHISLDLQAARNSLCGLRVVDRSVLLLKPEKELSRDSIYSLLPVKDLRGYSYRVQEDPRQFCDSANHRLVPVSQDDQMGDIAKLLQDMGLKILTDTGYHRPIECRIEEGIVMSYNERLHVADAMPGPFTRQRMVAAGPLGSPVSVREYFPETWIWDLVPVGSSGSISLPITVPDSITEWKGSMFCTGQAGFGISGTVSLNAFKPFFVDLALPYSVIRTEGFTLKAKVFNYMKQCIMVKITLLEAQGFNVTSDSSTAQETCICSKNSVTFSWNLTATELGEQNLTVQAESIASESLCGNEVITVPVKGAVDIIRKPLLVRPEGTETELTHSSFLCPAGKMITEKIHLQVPGDVVEGSSRAYITVLGDILGSAMENLDSLLRLPTGCGEQNMVKFAPNIYVLKYLTKTHQITGEIQNKVLGFLRTGYQNQLTFKHDDGSYSAFGTRDPEGNTWLTAFVLKSFLHARSYTFIDDAVLRQATKFFLNHRLESGCFASLGQLFNNAMKGGVDDNISLSAYVTASLLELERSEREMADKLYKDWRQKVLRERESPRDNVFSSVVLIGTVSPVNSDHNISIANFKTGVTDRALSCLRNALKTVNSTYTLTLLAYTFTLAGDQTTRRQILKRLEDLAIKKDGLTHWQREKKSEEEEPSYFWWRAASAEVEMTAYVVLALLSQPQVTNSDLGQATPIVSWLVKQRNSYGGFASTQDTVVALQALALYAELTHVSDPDSTLSITTEAKFHREFHIDSSNQLVLQRENLAEIPGDYTVQISGTSCLLLETTLRYNTPPAQKDSVFIASVEMLPANMKNGIGKEGSVHRIDINVTYIGDRPVSNMVIVDVQMLSGFSADPYSYRNSVDQFNVSKSEIQDGHMVLYIKAMESNRLIQLSFDATQNFVVENLQPAFVKVYDYYETDDSTIIEYPTGDGVVKLSGRSQ